MQVMAKVEHRRWRATVVPVAVPVQLQVEHLQQRRPQAAVAIAPASAVLSQEHPSRLGPFVHGTRIRLQVWHRLRWWLGCCRGRQWWLGWWWGGCTKHRRIHKLAFQTAFLQNLGHVLRHDGRPAAADAEIEA